MSLESTYPIEAIELGYFALNPATEFSKDLLLRYIILKELKIAGYWEIKKIDNLIIPIQNKIILPSEKITDLIIQLTKNNYTEFNSNKILITNEGIEFINNIKAVVVSHYNEAKKIFEYHGISKENHEIIFNAIEYLASRDSDLIANLLGIREEIPTYETEDEGLKFEIPDEKLRNQFINFINQSIVGNKNLRKFFLYLTYGHIAEYLLLSSSNRSLSEIFENLRRDSKEIKIILDTNAIIGMLCHYDNKNKLINSLLRFIDENQERVDIKFYYLDSTIHELQNLLSSLENIGNSLINQDPKNVQEIFETQKLYFRRSPLRAFYYENKYRDWEHYTFLFMTAWDSYKEEYTIEKVSTNMIENLESIRKNAVRHSKLLMFDDTIGKKLNVLTHDVFLFLISNELAKKYEKGSLMKNVLILTFDETFEPLERSIKYLDPNTTKQSLNLRQLIAYLSPLFEIKDIDLMIEEKLMFGSLIEDQRFIQNLTISLINKEKKLGIKRIPTDFSRESLKANTTLSKEIIFKESTEFKDLGSEDYGNAS